ncbi:MAG: aminotransferase class V-fold PLP-dependent enzyme [Novosphingobium sp.]
MPNAGPNTPTYLDHAATTPLLPAARDAWLEGMALWANPSSPHGPGRAARAGLEDARERVKAALAWDGEVVFTSGASEALALAIARCRLPLTGVSAAEHDAVLRHRENAAILPVDGGGLIEPASAALPGLIAVQHVNNETGVIQPLAAIATAVRAAGGLLLADCAQSAGKLALPDADLIAIAAHKFGGPIGVGALLVRDYAMLRPSGGQERGYRGGTEDLPGILAMAAALEAGAAWLAGAAALRASLETAIHAAGGEVVAAAALRIAAVGAYRMPGKSAVAQLIGFDAKGIAVSAGSACSSGSLRGSHVLAAMGVAGASEVIRVSIGRETTPADIDRFAAVWRALQPATASA